jgi:hypothetical protein
MQSSRYSNPRTSLLRNDWAVLYEGQERVSTHLRDRAEPAALVTTATEMCVCGHERFYHLHPMHKTKTCPCLKQTIQDGLRKHTCPCNTFVLQRATSTPTTTSEPDPEC